MIRYKVIEFIFKTGFFLLKLMATEREVEGRSGKPKECLLFEMDI